MKRNNTPVKQLSRKLFVCLTLRRFLFFGTLYLFACGLAMLVLRAMLGIPATSFFWAFAGIIPLFPAALLAELRNMPEHSCVVALLDQHNNLGGLLMAQDEADTSPWLALRQDIRTPSVVWHSFREWAMFGISVLFVATAVFMPHYFASPDTDNTLEISEMTKELCAKTDLLEQEEILEPSKALEIKDELDKLAKESVGKDPARTWETLDHISDNIASEAENHAEDLLETAKNLEQARQMAELLNDGSDIKAELKPGVMEELAKILQNTGNEAFDLSDFLDRDMMKSVRNSALTQEQMKKLISDMKICKKDVTGKLGRMCRAGLADKKLYEKSAVTGQSDKSELSAFLKENADNLTVDDITAACQMPGKSGISRGRGDALMTWKNPSSETGVRFKEERLPFSRLPSVMEKMKTGISNATPEKNKEPVPVSSGALSGVDPGEGSAITNQTLPRHRGIIRRYFDRQKEG